MTSPTFQSPGGPSATVPSGAQGLTPRAGSAADGVLAQGVPMLAIPGPTVVPDAVLAAMARPMQNIYAGEITDLSTSIVADLPQLLRTRNEAFIAIGNGHGGWDMALSNTLSRGDRVLVIDSGLFGQAWAATARAHGLQVETLAAPSWREPLDPQRLTDRLNEDRRHDLAAVLVAHVDTGSGIRADLATIRDALDAARHPALFMVDGVASVGCERLEMDAIGADIVITASQKGLMTPPGLAVVWASPKAIDAHQHADLVTPYWNWTPRRSDGPKYLLFSGTPPVSHLYGFRVALDLIFAEGLDHVWWRHEQLAAAVWAAVDAWADPDGFEFQVTDPAFRSHAVTGVLTNRIDADALRDHTEQRSAVTLGVGMGAPSPEVFRIGHMGHLNVPMVLGTLGAIEAALVALDAPMGGSGVAAAARVLGRALSVPNPG